MTTSKPRSRTKSDGTPDKRFRTDPTQKKTDHPMYNKGGNFNQQLSSRLNWLHRMALGASGNMGSSGAMLGQVIRRKDFHEAMDKMPMQDAFAIKGLIEDSYKLQEQLKKFAEQVKKVNLDKTLV